MRDSLTFNARSAIDRATDKMTRGSSAMNSWYSGNTTHDELVQHVKTAYLLGKRSAADAGLAERNASSNSERAVVEHSAGSSSSALVNSIVPQRSSACNAHTVAASSSMVDLTEIDPYINNIMNSSYLTHQVEDSASMTPSSSLNVIAYIDSQATNFVVPDVVYLSKVQSTDPDVNVETANGIIKPDAVGEAVVSLFDDDGAWHTFVVKNVWAMRTCSKVLYSQSAMREHGVVHRLDDGYILFDDGSRKSVSSNTYAVELSFGTQPADKTESAGEHSEFLLIITGKSF